MLPGSVTMRAAGEPRTKMLVTADKYSQLSAYELLDLVSSGKVGFDHRLLHAILDDPDRSIPDLVRWGTEDHSDAAFELDNELVAIFRYLKTPAALPFFVSYIKRDPQDLPDDLFLAIYPVKEAALEPLLALHDELDEEESGELAFILAGLRIRNDRVLEILLDRLEFDAGDGALSLGLYGDPAAKPALIKLRDELEKDDEHLRRDLEDAISQLGREATDEVIQAYDIWADFPEKAGPEFDLLSEDHRSEFLDSDDPEERAGAAASFINREYSDTLRNRLLRCAKRDNVVEVRAKCWEALSEKAGEDEVRDALLARLQDVNAPAIERAGALIGLANDADKPPVRALAEEFYTNPATRAAALKAMWGSMDRSFAPYFPKHIADPDIGVRKQAIAGVGYLGIHDVAEKLRQYFEDDELRPNALFAYALAMRSEISRSRVPGLLRRIDGFAGGLSEEETELVKLALDERLLLHGHEPYFFPDRDELDEDEELAAPEPVPAKAGRNDPCPCGSGKKFKKCCGA